MPPQSPPSFLDALLLSAGYNASVVSVGAALLGASAGVVGVFLVLRKRALVSDAAAHATLPGIVLAFMMMTALGGAGRDLFGLMLGAAASALVGLLLVDAMTKRTRLQEDAAIGAVLSVFFGLGIVLLTVAQRFSGAQQTGLETFLVGSASSMTAQDQTAILVVGGLSLAATLALRRPLAALAFDPTYTQAIGLRRSWLDAALMGIATAVTVIGLQLVGLVLIVALLIIPAVTARFWTHRMDRMLLIAGLLGAAAGYVGAAVSVIAKALPTGPVIVLVAAAMFFASLLVSPSRGVAAAVWRRHLFQRRVHLRQGLLALARGEPILERYTLRVLARAGLVRRDGVATPAGRAQAAKAARDEKRWEIAREVYRDTALPGRYDGLTPIESMLTRDEIAAIDARLGPPRVASPAGEAAL